MKPSDFLNGLKVGDKLLDSRYAEPENQDPVRTITSQVQTNLNEKTVSSSIEVDKFPYHYTKDDASFLQKVIEIPPTGAKPKTKPPAKKDSPQKEEEEVGGKTHTVNKTQEFTEGPNTVCECGGDGMGCLLEVQDGNKNNIVRTPPLTDLVQMSYEEAATYAGKTLAWRCRDRWFVADLLDIFADWSEDEEEDDTDEESEDETEEDEEDKKTKKKNKEEEEEEEEEEIATGNREDRVLSAQMYCVMAHVYVHAVDPGAAIDALRVLNEVAKKVVKSPGDYTLFPGRTKPLPRLEQKQDESDQKHCEWERGQVKDTRIKSPRVYDSPSPRHSEYPRGKKTCCGNKTPSPPLAPHARKRPSSPLSRVSSSPLLTKSSPLAYHIGHVRID